MAAELRLDFPNARLNAAPEGFRSTLTGAGSPGDWQVILDHVPGAKVTVSSSDSTDVKTPVLAQLSRDRTGEHYPLLVYEKQKFWDFKLSTKFKIVSGQEEQMAGIAFRIQDEKNYYYIRASALGKSFYFFKRVNDQLSPPLGMKMDIPGRRLA